MWLKSLLEWKLGLCFLNSLFFKILFPKIPRSVCDSPPVAVYERHISHHSFNWYVLNTYYVLEAISSLALKIFKLL